MRNNLLTHSGCLMFGNCMVIPCSIQAAVLIASTNEKSRMKMPVRDDCCWPKNDKDIKDKVNFCTLRQENAKPPEKTTLCPWGVENEPWTRIHANLGGPIDGRTYLVIVDAYFKQPEIILCRLRHLPQLSNIFIASVHNLATPGYW